MQQPQNISNSLDEATTEKNVNDHNVTNSDDENAHKYEQVDDTQFYPIDRMRSFLQTLEEITPTIPDELVEHLATKTGFSSPDLQTFFFCVFFVLCFLTVLFNHLILIFIYIERGLFLWQHKSL